MNDEIKRTKIDYSISQRIDSNYSRINSIQKKIDNIFEKFDEEKKEITLKSYINLMNLFFEDVVFSDMSHFVVNRIHLNLKTLLQIFGLSGLHEEIEVCVWTDKPRYIFSRQYVYSQIFKIIRLYKRTLKQKKEEEQLFEEKINNSIKEHKGDD